MVFLLKVFVWGLDWPIFVKNLITVSPAMPQRPVTPETPRAAHWFQRRLFPDWSLWQNEKTRKWSNKRNSTGKNQFWFPGLIDSLLSIAHDYCRCNSDPSPSSRTVVDWAAKWFRWAMPECPVTRRFLICWPENWDNSVIKKEKKKKKVHECMSCIVCESIFSAVNHNVSLFQCSPQTFLFQNRSYASRTSFADPRSRPSTPCHWPDCKTCSCRWDPTGGRNRGSLLPRRPCPAPKKRRKWWSHKSGPQSHPPVTQTSSNWRKPQFDGILNMTHPNYRIHLIYSWNSSPSSHTVRKYRIVPQYSVTLAPPP